jgi:decaprenylphospho-beta-D-ribofuranose 2-oxidase
MPDEPHEWWTPAPAGTPGPAAEPAYSDADSDDPIFPNIARATAAAAEAEPAPVVTRATPAPSAPAHVPVAYTHDEPPQERLTGWGRTSPTVAHVAHPRTPEEVAEAIAGAGPRGVVARGLGRSYGDPAQNAGGLVIDMTGLNRILSVDLETGLVAVEAGVSLHALMRALVPFGYFVPVTPGTRYVTVGGAIGCDIHGKNHHADGSFAQHVLSMDLLLADGSVRTVTPEGDPELFWATAGGMGLTGVVLSAVIRMLPIETSLLSVDTFKLPDLDSLMERLAGTDTDYRYTVAWMDCLAKGAKLGRALLDCGNFATRDELPAKHRADPLAFSAKPLAAVPDVFPSRLLNRRTIALANEVWYRKTPSTHHHLASISGFFHPLDGIKDWNRVYGRSGFLQYQFVVPFSADVAFKRMVERISRVQAPSFVTVLKRFGKGSPGYLSFPQEGWTLALDFPTNTPGLDRLLPWLDEQVLAEGGRIYLAKDSRLAPDRLAAMYPRLEDYRKVRASVDPHGVFVSDQSRRLGL